jgi:hypothetical protein
MATVAIQFDFSRCCARASWQPNDDKTGNAPRADSFRRIRQDTLSLIHCRRMSIPHNVLSTFVSINALFSINESGSLERRD